MNRCALLVAVGLALLAGCAANGNKTDDNNTAAASDDKDYVTGSRLPVKNHDKSGARGTSDRNTIDDMMRRGGSATGGVSGAGGG